MAGQYANSQFANSQYATDATTPTGPTPVGSYGDEAGRRRKKQIQRAVDLRQRYIEALGEAEAEEQRELLRESVLAYAEPQGDEQERPDTAGPSALPGAEQIDFAAIARHRAAGEQFLAALDAVAAIRARMLRDEEAFLLAVAAAM